MPAAVRYNAPSWPIDTLPLRGCVLCDHGRDLSEPGLVCRHPTVAARGVPSESARRSGGACGPEASLLTIKGVAL